MKHAKIVIALALALLGAVPAAAAMAHEFNATEMGKLTLKQAGTARFRSASGVVECKSEQLILGDAPLASKTLLMTVEYSGCKAFGLSATLSPARYELNADGTASLVHTTTAKAIGCLVTFPSSKNQNLGTVKYSQRGKEIVEEENLAAITSLGEGASCSYAEESKGTFLDTALLGLASGVGSVEWK